MFKLIREGFKSFKLKRLDLSLNQFESLDGLYDFLKRHEIRDDDDELEGLKDKGCFCLESLLLDGNRIVQIHDLVRLATKILNSISVPPLFFLNHQIHHQVLIHEGIGLWRSLRWL